jgi:hypothetical protein
MDKIYELGGSNGRVFGKCLIDVGSTPEFVISTLTAYFLPGYEASAWYGIIAPKTTPAEVIDTLNKATERSVWLSPFKSGATGKYPDVSL